MEIIALSRKGHMSSFKPLLKSEDESDGICMIRFIDSINGRFLGQIKVKAEEDNYVAINKMDFYNFVNGKGEFEDYFVIMKIGDKPVRDYKEYLSSINVDYKQMEIDFNLILKEVKSDIDKTEIEQNMFVYFDIDRAIISSLILTNKANASGESINNFSLSTNYSTLKGQSNKPILFQIHTHPKGGIPFIGLPSSSGSTINSKEIFEKSGTSKEDFEFATENKMLVVAIAKFQGEKYNYFDPSKVEVYYVQQNATNYRTINTYQKGNLSQPKPITLDIILKDTKIFFDDMITLTLIS